MPKELKRCSWAEKDPLMRQYHDEEWGVPQYDSRELWEMLQLEGFQAGLSWQTILNRREGFQKAFAKFDPTKVAKFTPTDIKKLMANEDIIRAELKILATIGNAKAYLEMKKNGEDFSDFVWSYVNHKPIKGDGKSIIAKSEISEKLSKDLKKKGFKFCGPVIMYAWMQAVGMLNDHQHDCFRRDKC